MAAQTPGNRNSYVYVGLAGETAPGRRVNSGLYRMADGDDEWTLLEAGLPQAPAIRALTIHPENPSTVYAGTQDGPYVSTDPRRPLGKGQRSGPWPSGMVDHV